MSWPKTTVQSLRKIISFLLTITLVLVCSLVTQAVQTTQRTIIENTNNKIGDELIDLMQVGEEDTVYEIWLFLSQIDQETIDSLMLNETGKDPNIYENEERFNKVIKPVIENRILDQLNYIGDLEKEESTIKEKMKLDKAINEAIFLEYDHYWTEKKEIAFREGDKLLDSFISENVPATRRILLRSCFGCTLILEATKAEIGHYATLDGVDLIGLYIEEIAAPTLVTASSQIGVYCEGGTGFDQLDGWLAFTGSGVRIGVIDFGKFRANAPMLANKQNLFYVDSYDANGVVIPYSETDHPTHVLSVLCGKTTSVSGTYFRGIAPNAIVYQTTIVYLTDMIRSAEMLIEDYSVRLINFSGGQKYPTSDYTYYDREVDRICYGAQGAVFVNSAGNIDSYNPNGYISSPGKAVGAITVGNAATKLNSMTAASPPYPASPITPYIMDDYLPNKPDIVAPGTAIVVPNDSVTTVTKNGTSIATPMVTGVIAQMFEAKPSLIGNPTAVKALLMLGADYAKILATGNEEVGNHLRQKSGAGLLNSINAVQFALGIAHVATLDAQYSVNIAHTVYLEEGQTCRVQMAFNKKNYAYLDSETTIDNLDLWVINQTIGFTVSSTSQNATEYLEFTVPENGTYMILVINSGLYSFSEPPQASVAYVIE